MKRRGLIYVSKKGKRSLYYAENPKKLKTEIEEKGKFVESILPELLSLTNAIDQKPKVRFFDTREGIYDIYRETLEYEGDKIHMWMSTPWYDDEKFWREIYMPKRIEKRILIKVIVPKTDEAVEFVKDDRASLRETRMTDSHNITADRDFMIQLTQNEFNSLRFQIGTSSSRRGGRR